MPVSRKFFLKMKMKRNQPTNNHKNNIRKNHLKCTNEKEEKLKSEIIKYKQINE